MATSKAALIRQGGVTHQQALVEAMNPIRQKPVKRVIPGGSNMLDTLDQKRLEGAVYNWLRGTRQFSQVTISMARDPNIYNLARRKLIEFPEANDNQPIWMTHPERKKYLSGLIADALRRHKLVTLEVDKTGIYITVDTSDQFGPTREATQDDVDEALLQLEPGEELGWGIGDIVHNEAWEPYIEFIPHGKGRYGY